MLFLAFEIPWLDHFLRRINSPMHLPPSLIQFFVSAFSCILWFVLQSLHLGKWSSCELSIHAPFMVQCKRFLHFILDYTDPVQWICMDIFNPEDVRFDEISSFYKIGVLKFYVP